MNNRTVIVITGPTASGKTSLGVSLALALGTEVVSADSMQLYRGMDIGSAKPTREEMRGVPHHMIDVADPAEDYSVSRWVENAAACCDVLLAGGKTPVIVGGTGLYIESLLSGRDFSAAPGDSGVREALGAEYDALAGLSQKAACPVQEPVTPGGAGHGCGHNLLGTGCYAAAVALKDYLEREKKDGTVIFFGCPAEEGAGSKQFIARAGYFDGVDHAFHTSSPDQYRQVPG